MTERERKRIMTAMKKFNTEDFEGGMRILQKLAGIPETSLQKALRGAKAVPVDQLPKGESTFSVNGQVVGARKLTAHQQRILKSIVTHGAAWPASPKDRLWLEEVTGIRIQRENPIHEPPTIFALFNDQALANKCREILEAGC